MECPGLFVLGPVADANISRKNAKTQKIVCWWEQTLSNRAKREKNTIYKRFWQSLRTRFPFDVCDAEASVARMNEPRDTRDIKSSLYLTYGEAKTITLFQSKFMLN